MTPGDIVIYKADALLFGKMLILSADNGRCTCEAIHADPDGEYARGEFSAHELAPYSQAKATV